MSNITNQALALVVLVVVVLGCKSLTGSAPDTQANANSSANTTSLANSAARSDTDKIKDLKAKAGELAALDPPVKLDPNAKIDGKVALVIVSADGRTELEGFDGDKLYENGIVDYRFTKSEVASSVDEIDDLVQIKCSKGKQVGTYDSDDGIKIPAYELKCDVNVIDYKAGQVVAQKSFSSKRLDEDIEVSASRTEKTAYMPRRDIADFLDTLR